MAFKRYETTFWRIDLFLFFFLGTNSALYWFALCHSIDNARRLKESGALVLSHWAWVTDNRNDDGIMRAKKREKENIRYGEKRENVRRRWKSELKATYVNSDSLECVEWTWVQWQFEYGIFCDSCGKGATPFFSIASNQLLHFTCHSLKSWISVWSWRCLAPAWRLVCILGEDCSNRLFSLFCSMV